MPLLPLQLPLFSGPLLFKQVNSLLNLLKLHRGFIETCLYVTEVLLRFDRLHLKLGFALLCLLYEPFKVFPLACLLTVECVTALGKRSFFFVKLYGLPVYVSCFVHAHL